MEPNTLKFSSLGYFSPDDDPLRNYLSFCRILNQTKFIQQIELAIKEKLPISESLRKITINLAAGGFLGLAEISVLALLIRKFAEAKIKINVIWPKKVKGGLTPLHYSLERLKFDKLFESVHGDWTENVFIQDKSPVVLKREGPIRKQNYVALCWIDKSCIEKTNGNWWTSRLKVRLDSIETLKNILYFKDFINSEERNL